MTLNPVKCSLFYLASKKKCEGRNLTPGIAGMVWVSGWFRIATGQDGFFNHLVNMK